MYDVLCVFGVVFNAYLYVDLSVVIFLSLDVNARCILVSVCMHVNSLEISTD